MKRAITVLLASFTVFSFQGTRAAETCDKYTNSYDKTYCFSKLFVESDTQLNVAYKALYGFLQGRDRVRLQQAERDWIKYRDRTCQTNPGAINVECNYEVNRKRSEYLRSRLLECKAGACHSDMIGSHSWQ